MSYPISAFTFFQKALRTEELGQAPEADPLEHPGYVSYLPNEEGNDIPQVMTQTTMTMTRMIRESWTPDSQIPVMHHQKQGLHEVSPRPSMNGRKSK